MTTKLVCSLRTHENCSKASNSACMFHILRCVRRVIYDEWQIRWENRGKGSRDREGKLIPYIIYDVLYQLNIHNQLIIRSLSIKNLSNNNDDYVRLITETL